MATAVQQRGIHIPQIRKAEKRRVKLKMGIQGPSGSGKTKGALYLARNLWPDAKICVVDTENESASLYADEFEFDTIPLEPPFDSERYIACINAIVAGGYDVGIMDSISHQWEGDGGILDQKSTLDQRPGSNSFTNWNSLTPDHRRFIEAIKQCPMHIIATMRTKQEYALEPDGKGKTKPVKIGMTPIQRDGVDYEFSLVFDVQMDHKATVVKNRTGLFEKKIIDLKDVKVADALRNWLDSGKEPEAVTLAPVAAPLNGHTNGHGPQPVQTKPHVKVEEWSLSEDGTSLRCYVYDVQEKVSKNKEPFMAIKHNGKVAGKDMVFCFNQRLFDALRASKGQHVTLYVDTQRDYTQVADVIRVGEQEYRDGLLWVPAPPNCADIQDDDIPF